jgi:hypothetical protein
MSKPTIVNQQASEDSCETIKSVPEDKIQGVILRQTEWFSSQAVSAEQQPGKPARGLVAVWLRR